MQCDWLSQPAAPLNEAARLTAEKRQAQLAKPPGSLGALEIIVIQLAAMQGVTCPKLEQVQITIFAADHGVVAEGISAFPQAVTLEMVRNFARGGAAICVLAKQLNAAFEVVNLGTVEADDSLPGVRNQRIAPGTANFTRQSAMAVEQLAAALDAGQQSVARAADTGCQLFIGGEMGIGNTTSASALACALTGMPPTQLTGPGTGLDKSGVNHKIEVIQHALDQHQAQLNDPIEILRRLGGFEIAALTGSYITCAQRGVPVLVDGFISSVAALLAVSINSAVREWLLFAHKSAEPGHTRVLEALKAGPLLDIGMRLGEGSGAATALPLLRLACALHNEMATFSEASVSEKDG